MKGGKSRKRTTSKGRRIKRLRDRFRWPHIEAEDLERELVATKPEEPTP